MTDRQLMLEAAQVLHEEAVFRRDADNYLVHLAARLECAARPTEPADPIVGPDESPFSGLEVLAFNRGWRARENRELPDA